MTVCDIVLNTADQPFSWALGLCLLSLVLHVMKPSMEILALPVKTSVLLHRDLCFSVFTLACCQHSILYVTQVFFLINANHNMLDFCLWRTKHTNPGHGSALCKMCCLFQHFRPRNPDIMTTINTPNINFKWDPKSLEIRTLAVERLLEPLVTQVILVCVFTQFLSGNVVTYLEDVALPSMSPQRADFQVCMF